MLDTPSFIAGIAVGLLVVMIARHYFPGIVRDAEVKKLKKLVEDLEDRLAEKDRLIRKAIKATGDNP